MERTTVKTLKVLLHVARNLTKRDLSLETWAPGDGWTRYRVEENGGSSNVSHYLTKSQCETWLRAFIAGAESVVPYEQMRQAWKDAFTATGSKVSA